MKEKIIMFIKKNKNGFISLSGAKKILLIFTIFFFLLLVGLTANQLVVNAQVKSQIQTEESLPNNEYHEINTEYIAKINKENIENAKKKYNEQLALEEAEKAASIKEVIIKSSSVEEDLEVSLRDKDNNILNADTFIINVKSDKYDKDWEVTNGWLKLNKLSAGTYTVTVKEKDGYKMPEPIECKVVKKVAYEKVDVSDQIKNDSQIDSSKDDASFNQPSHETGSATPAEPPKDTVDFVDSTESKKEEIKENITYKFKPILSDTGTILFANGQTSEIYPRVDENGYIIGAYKIKREPISTPTPEITPVSSETTITSTIETTTSEIAPLTVEEIQYKEEQIDEIILDSNGEPLKDESGNYILQFEKIKIKQSETIEKPIFTGWQTIDGKKYYFDKDGNKVTGTQVIQGVTYYFNSNGEQISQTIAIDVSKYQYNIDWNAVKAAGVDYAIIRVGFRGYGSGALVEDSYFKKNIQGATAAGLKVGVYFFSQAVNTEEAVAEASMCLELTQGYNLSLPIYFDTEYTGNGGRADGLSANHRTTIAVAFCETIQKSGKKAGIYASKSWFYNQLEFSRISQYSIWVAHYTSAEKTDFKYNYDIWQYTGSGTCSGIQTSVDKNIIYKLF